MHLIVEKKCTRGSVDYLCDVQWTMAYIQNVTNLLHPQNRRFQARLSDESPEMRIPRGVHRSEASNQDNKIKLTSLGSWSHDDFQASAGDWQEPFWIKLNLEASLFRLCQEMTEALCSNNWYIFNINLHSKICLIWNWFWCIFLCLAGASLTVLTQFKSIWTSVWSPV